MKFFVKLFLSIFYFIKNLVISLILIVLIGMMFFGYWSAVGPKNNYGSSEAASWMQAIGAFSAILVAFWMGERQISINRNDDRKKSKTIYIRQVDIICIVLGRAKFAAEHIIHCIDIDSPAQYLRVPMKKLLACQDTFYTDSVLNFPDAQLLYFCFEVSDAIERISINHSEFEFSNFGTKGLEHEKKESLISEMKEILEKTEAAIKYSEFFKTSYFYRMIE